TTVSHGWERLPELARTGKWKTLLKEANDIKSVSNSRLSSIKIAWMYGVKPLVPESFFYIRRIMRGQFKPEWRSNTAINPAFARRVGVADRVREEIVPVGGSGEEHWRALTSPLLPDLLETVNKAAAPFSLEGRYPFFDRRLIEFCLALPPERKFSQGWSRIILRRAMQGILPEEVQWRLTKGNLSPNFYRGLLCFEKETLDEVILRDPSIIEDYVDISALRAAYKRYSSRPMQSDADALTVYCSVTLARWLQISSVV
ncbi:MAG: hypothetical protein KAR13_17235, partial [Desulfobulbaceae bacterium]|nr:hypothetical protein [Desulfobulbaceae bacterium]